MSNSLFNRRLLCGALMGSLGFVACGPMTEAPSSEDAKFGQARAALPGPVVASCAELKAAGLGMERDYVLYLNADFAKPYVAYCSAEGGTYLTPPSGPSANYSQKLNVSGNSVITQWNRVRFNPQTLTVDTGDFRFASSTGFIPAWNQSTVNYGSAGDCAAPYSNTGRANVDLTGLPFVVTANWQTSGYLPSGSATKSSNDQVVSISGGGYCGDMGLNGAFTLSYRNRFPR